MAEFSRFYGSADGDTREYNQIEFAEVFKSIISNGILKLDNELAITPNTPASMTVLIDTGQAWINGYWYKNDASKILNIDSHVGTGLRIDAIVLRLNTITDRIIELAVLKGTPSEAGTFPTLTQNEEVYEFLIGYVYISEITTSIALINITDNRKFTDKAIYKTFTATIPYTSWIGSSAPYSKVVNVTGILATDEPIIDLALSGTYATDVTMRENWSKIYRGVCTTDTITFYADSVPSADISIQIVVVR